MTMLPRNDLLDGLRQGVLLAAALLVVTIPVQRAPTPGGLPRDVATASAVAPSRPMLRRPDFAGAARSAEVEAVAGWVVATADNGTLDFAIVDKRHASVHVFEVSGRLLGTTPVLLGYAVGDDSVAGIGERPIEAVRPEERTTPAGRFVAEPGRNALDEEVVWVDYGAAVSMHRVRLTNPAERRAARLASPTAADNRISFGCINMPPRFFDTVLWPRFRTRGGIVYVLPEVRPLYEVFPALRDGGHGATVVRQLTAHAWQSGA